MNDDMFEPMNGDDPLGPSPTSAPKSKGRTWKRHYTRVPDEWVKRLRKAKRVSTWRLACELLYLHWKDGDGPIAVAGKVIRTAEISRWSAYNALAELQRLGLVQVEQERGQAPRTILLRVDL